MERHSDVCQVFGRPCHLILSSVCSLTSHPPSHLPTIAQAQKLQEAVTSWTATVAKLECDAQECSKDVGLVLDLASSATVKQNPEVLDTWFALLRKRNEGIFSWLSSCESLATLQAAAVNDPDAAPCDEFDKLVALEVLQKMVKDLAGASDQSDLKVKVSDLNNAKALANSLVKGAKVTARKVKQLMAQCEKEAAKVAKQASADAAECFPPADVGPAPLPAILLFRGAEVKEVPKLNGDAPSWGDTSKPFQFHFNAQDIIEKNAADGVWQGLLDKFNRDFIRRVQKGGVRGQSRIKTTNAVVDALVPFMAPGDPGGNFILNPPEKAPADVEQQVFSPYLYAMKDDMRSIESTYNGIAETRLQLNGSRKVLLLPLIPLMARYESAAKNFDAMRIQVYAWTHDALKDFASNHAVYWVEVVPNMLLFVPSGFMVVDGCNHRCGNNIGIRQTVLCTSDREVLEQVHRCLGTSNSVRQAVIAMLK